MKTPLEALPSLFLYNILNIILMKITIDFLSVVVFLHIQEFRIFQELYPKREVTSSTFSSPHFLPDMADKGNEPTL